MRVLANNIICEIIYLLFIYYSFISFNRPTIDAVKTSAMNLANSEDRV